MKLTASTKFAALLAAAIFLLAAKVVMALPSSGIGIIEGVEVPKGYTIAPLHLTGIINDVTVDHNGTIEELFAQLEAEHPELGADLTAASSPDVESLDKVNTLNLQDRRSSANRFPALHDRRPLHPRPRSELETCQRCCHRPRNQVPPQ